MKNAFKLLILFMMFEVAGKGNNVELIQVKTRAKENRIVNFYYRIPADYDEKKPLLYRVLIVFGGRNTNGKSEAQGAFGWGEWADLNNCFIIAPGFKNDDYWVPEKWSGVALQKALSQIKKKYKICSDKLFFYGYSAGSQAANLFAVWKVERTRAYVSHACGVFHEPTPQTASVPGLIMCGDADFHRYIISRNFVEKARKKGAFIIWKSFPNHPHDVPPDSIELARVFLSYYHQKYQSDLINSNFNNLSNAPDKSIYVGDDQENVFYPIDSAQAQNIYPEDRVYFPTLALALAWGQKSQIQEKAE